MVMCACTDRCRTANPTHGELVAVVKVVRLLLLDLVVAIDIEACRVRTRHDVVEQLKGPPLKRLCLDQQLSEQVVGLLGGEEIVKNGTGSVLGHLFRAVQM
jgi:hypothetical protein